MTSEHHRDIESRLSYHTEDGGGRPDKGSQSETSSAATDGTDVPWMTTLSIRPTPSRTGPTDRSSSLASQAKDEGPDNSISQCESGPAATDRRGDLWVPAGSTRSAEIETAATDKRSSLKSALRRVGAESRPHTKSVSFGVATLAKSSAVGENSRKTRGKSRGPGSADASVDHDETRRKKDWSRREERQRDQVIWDRLNAESGATPMTTPVPTHDRYPSLDYYHPDPR